EMIALCMKRKPLQIACSQTHKMLVGLELQIDVVPPVGRQPVHLIRTVDHVTQSNVCAECRHRRHQYQQQTAADGTRVHGAACRSGPAPGCATPVAGLEFSSSGASCTTSGSATKSRILKPRGFQRRMAGSCEGAA